MDEMKLKLANAVAAKLTAAPQSAAKDELIEELSDNLYRRFLDMAGAGMEEEAAFQRAMDDLGDVDELLSYLGVEPAWESPDAVINSDGGQTRIETKNGQRIIINGSDDGHIVINTGAAPEEADEAQEEADEAQAEADEAQAEADEAQAEADEAQAEADEAQAEADEAQAEADEAQERADEAQERADEAQDTGAADAAQEGADLAQEEADAAQARADAAQARADAAQARADAAQARADAAREGRRDGRGDVHYDYDIPQSDLDAILAGVSEVCNTAIDQAKAALKQAKEAIQRRTTVKRNSGHVTVHFNTHPNTPTKAPETPETPETPEPPETPETPDTPETPEIPETPEAPETPDTPEAPEAPEEAQGWEFEAELDTDAGRFFAGAGPKQRKDVIYGFGYDKAKGGFFAQWGEWPGEYQDGPEFQGPRFTGEQSGMQANEDGSYSVTALRDLRGIEVFTAAGDVVIHVSEAPDAGVIIDGDVDDLDVTCSADGVLTIREGRTASSSFFSRRGFCSADVELFIPRRHWEVITVSTASGDIDIDRDALDVDRFTVTTASGDLSCRLRACAALSFKSASGDLDLEGSCASLTADTMSGDISLRGQVEDAAIKSASGDIELAGLVCRFRGTTMSGDVEVDTSVQPQSMDMSSKSGDCKARIPDAGPFAVRMKTVSGRLGCDFPVNHVNGLCVYGDCTDGCPAYSMTTVSGDVSLKRR